MLRIILVGIAALLVAISAPVILLDPVTEPENEEYLLIVYPKDEDENLKIIDLKTENGVQSMKLEDYLVGVVLSEMPASFELEALKAQAVAARTFAMRQMGAGKHDDCDLCSNSACCQAWTSRMSMEEKLGSSFSAIWEKGKRAVEETKYLVITYDDELIDAVYFSCSGGKTEDAVEVWGNDIPYLRSVLSPGEENSQVYSSEVKISPELFSNIVKKWNSAAELGDNIAGWFGASKRTVGGGVKYMEIGGITCSGTEIRTLFGLKSTNFHVSVTEEEIVFSVLGYGHRVGMSQYGANALACAGKSFEEILKFYYSDVSIQKYP